MGQAAEPDDLMSTRGSLTHKTAKRSLMPLILGSRVASCSP